MAGLLWVAALNALLFVILVHLQTFSPAVIAQSPSVTVAEQKGVPLIISVEGYDASDPSSPRVNYKVQNVSDKAVRAYTILEETANGREGGTGVKIVNLTREYKFLQPYQVRPESCDVSSHTGPIVNLTLSVDYVEFGDRTAWGKDTRRSADYLGGERAGKNDAIKKIQEIREKQGLGVVEELLKKKDTEVVGPPSGHSSEWEYGFRVGHNSALYQLRAAHGKGGRRR